MKDPVYLSQKSYQSGARRFHNKSPCDHARNLTRTRERHHVLAAGLDVLIAATGYMVHEAKKALAGLRHQGIEATLVDLYCYRGEDQ
jgi:transketolase C-terminal domain/subunit